jgi:biotin carboxyl carrier protein
VPSDQPDSSEPVHQDLHGERDVEGGRLYYRDGYDTIAVSVKVIRYLTDHGLEQQLGFPVSAEESLSAAQDRKAQFFDGGLVTIRAGVIEAWLPASSWPAPWPIAEAQADDDAHSLQRPPAGPPPESPEKGLVAVSMPQLGGKVTKGTVTRWLKRAGERVAVNEPLLEVSTDKVDFEIPSPAAGTLVSIQVDEDETVDGGTQLAAIEEDLA